MKKIHIIAVLFFSFFVSESFANGVKFNSEGFVFTIAEPSIISTISSITSCEGSDLTIAANPTTGTAPFTYSWSGPNSFSSTIGNPTINNISLSDAGTYNLTITDNLGTTFFQNTVVIVNAKTDPVFESILPYLCSGGIPPLLSNTSTNGITGTWSPALNNNTTTTYTFAPSSGQCANSVFLTIFVVPNVIPTFFTITTICQGDTPPVLSTISNNGIVGTWTPAVVNNTTAGSYIFTPIAVQCATTKTLNFTIISPITIVFSPIPPICYGAILAPLPTTSTNGIIGNWSPELDNTKTTTYTFTPNPGQCASNPVNLTIEVNPLSAIFNPVTPICFGAILAPLPTTSTNGVTGIWAPALDNTITKIYTFTPDADQCAPSTTLTITVNPLLIPLFNPIADFCSGSVSPTLSLISNNGIIGTWNPATISNTTSETYTFTPTAGQCATSATLSVSISLIATPLFIPIPDICFGSIAPSLATISNNGFSGTWNPATISTTTSGTYTFTPSPSQCAGTTTLDVIVTIITPVFTTLNPICKNATAPLLPTISNNGISGVWNPATVDNLASGNYLFTPDSGQCASTKTIAITINPFELATFNSLNPICFGSISPTLQLTSNNGFSGTWSPTTISNTVSGTYTFTPNSGECTFDATLNVIVIPKTNTIFEPIPPICSGSTPPVLPTTSTNMISGIWNPALVSNTESKTYNFTSNSGECGTETSLNVTVFSSPIDIEIKITDVINDGSEGIIEIISVTNGQAPFQYKINTSSFTSDVLYSNLTNGNYTIAVRDSNGCEYNKIVTINSICLFPNAISPNGDAYNDTFNLKGCDVVKLEIFNRYGRKVNSYSDYSDQWNGKTSGGEALPDGTYYYTAILKEGTSKSGWIYITK